MAEFRQSFAGADMYTKHTVKTTVRSTLTLLVSKPRTIYGLKKTLSYARSTRQQACLSIFISYIICEYLDSDSECVVNTLHTLD